MATSGNESPTGSDTSPPLTRAFSLHIYIDERSRQVTITCENEIPYIESPEYEMDNGSLSLDISGIPPGFGLYMPPRV